MFSKRWHFALLIALCDLLEFSSAFALFVPEALQHNAALWAPGNSITIPKRAQDTCGAGLDSCGAAFPSNFCCSTGTTCLALNTTSTITAALCCPAGQDCKTIGPINCNQELQNATSSPDSQLHSSPTAELETCGTACCPMGYACSGASFCVAQTAAPAAAAAAAAAAATLNSSPSPVSTSPTSTPTATAPSVSESASPVEKEESSNAFSGKSFAAGFVPGIALGAFLTACIIYACVRRQRKEGSSYVDDKKQRSPGRDTLTDLAPFTAWRPTVHGRSISEPSVDMTMGHRTEFLNSSPQHLKEPSGNGSSPVGYMTTRDTRNPPQRKHWLSHSPFVNQVRSPMPAQSPLPSHMKRGTLSFQISPVRGLKKQRSMHSLRRHVTSATSRSNSSRQNGTSRTDSTETIKVLMATPQGNFSNAKPSRPTPPPLPTVASWQTAIESTNNTPVDAEPPFQFPVNNNDRHETPTRPGRNSGVPHIGATLSSPYTPSNHLSNSRHISHVAVKDDSRTKIDSLWPPAPHERDSMWRHTGNTTFSGLMEKAGLRKSSLLMGPDPREWNK